MCFLHEKKIRQILDGRKSFYDVVRIVLPDFSVQFENFVFTLVVLIRLCARQCTVADYFICLTKILFIFITAWLLPFVVQIDIIVEHLFATYFLTKVKSHHNFEVQLAAEHLHTYILI